MNIIAVIPCYNEEHFIGGVVSGALKYVNKVIVVDDGSQDNTSIVARESGAKVVRHETKQGAGAATRSGFTLAKKENADIIITLDGDGQHNPDEISVLLRPIETNIADLVIGSRFFNYEQVVRRYRKIGIDIITVLYNIFSKVKVSDSQSGFRAFNKKAIDTIRITDNGFGFSIEMLVRARKAGLRISAVPISCIYHHQGSTLNPLFHGLSVVWSLIKFRLILLS